MFSKHCGLEQILLPTGLAVGMLVVTGYLLVIEQLTVLKGLGFLAGLASGFLSFASGALRKRQDRKRSWLRALELLFSPFAFLLLLPFAVPFAGGFFLGGVVSFCLSWAATSVISYPTGSSVRENGIENT